MNKFFKGKVAVVTGAASGIGLAFCRCLAEKGAFTAMLDMDEKALESCEKEFSAQGFDHLCIHCDITDQASCTQAVDRVLARFSRIDILFNNAGITQRGAFEKTRVSVFKKVMDVNFYGALYCTKAALPALMESKGSIIVNESIAGVAPLLGRTGYSASKHALHGLFTSLRCELRHKNVHVMTVCPGFIRTGLQTRALGPDGNIAVHERTIAGREDTPEHAAEMITKGLARKKSMLVLTFVGKTGYILSRISPGLYEYLMTRRFKKEI